ncbi:hypothetical protein CASFOL_017946 [Castilleja foliolosa]|uniref:Uncharacterized protein n=1 Tax=Castilleja foliolosa TaxID=1961234 RepID=A0ABD3DCH1_9LAMI
MNERFNKPERALSQIAEVVKELQQSQEMSENVWTCPVALEVEPLVSLEPVHFKIAEETRDDVSSINGPVFKKTCRPIIIYSMPWKDKEPKKRRKRAKKTAQKPDQVLIELTLDQHSVNTRSSYNSPTHSVEC